MCIRDSPASVPSFERHIPERHRTTIVADENAPASVVIDARDGRALFPLVEEPRTFKSQHALDVFMQAAFGATTVKSDTQQSKGFMGTSLQHGTPYFYDPDPGLTYRITDPLLALVGGAYGKVHVGDDVVCVDPDGACDGGYASYLEPVGERTIPTHRTNCSANGVCVQHHSFWNDYVIFNRWIRHGANIRFTTYGALEDTVLTAHGRIFYNYSSAPVSSTFFLPRVELPGVDSAETAAFCWGGCPDHLANAIVVCGETRVSDRDINSFGRTGSGPTYDPNDPGWQCP